MSTFTKVAIPLALALPLAAYVLGTLMSADPDPADHEPIQLRPITLTHTPGPTNEPSTGTPGADPENETEDETSTPRQPEVVRPAPVVPDEDGDDDWDDDDDDDDDDTDTDDDDDDD